MGDKHGAADGEADGRYGGHRLLAGREAVEVLARPRDGSVQLAGVEGNDGHVSLPAST